MFMSGSGWGAAKGSSNGMRLFAYSWKLPAYSGAFLLAVDNLSFCAYSWSFFISALAFLLAVGAFLLTVGKCV